MSTAALNITIPLSSKEPIRTVAEKVSRVLKGASRGAP
jgi:hypothetical protein